ncbi:hypothetical protein AcV5_010543 [Taiwanofungus camphoratus]|nr:hypothetical protein AcV7_007195 [Antrodia cinnamomea]KAI0923118.1 hypothetical protein AcV5_010543 [Antrodia cinnamomea]
MEGSSLGGYILCYDNDGHRDVDGRRVFQRTYDTQFIYRNDYILPEIQFIKALMEKKVPAFKECLHLSLVSVTHRSRNYERWISKTSSSVTTHCAFTSRSTLFSSGT